MADPRIRSAATSLNQQLLNETIRYAHQVEAWKNGAARKVRRMIERDVMPDLLEQFDGLDGSETRFDSQRVRQSLVAADQIATRLRGVRDEVARDMGDFAVTEAEWQARVIGDRLPIDYSMRLPSLATLETLATKSPIHGRLLEDWWFGIETNLQQRVRQQLTIGLSAGETNRDVARRLSNVTGRTLRDSMVVTRTTANHVSTMAREATFEANADIVERVRLVATLDRRTTLICQSMDGQVFRVGEGSRPPFHQACRTTVVPIVKSWSEVPGGRNLPPATRASMDGQVPGSTTYRDWLRQQPKGVQDEVLGPSRAALFRDGRVDIDRFTDPTGRRIPLDQLRRREGLDRGQGGLFNLRQASRAASEQTGVLNRARSAWREVQRGGAFATASRANVAAGEWWNAASAKVGDATGYSALPAGVKRNIGWAASKAANLPPELASLFARAGGASPASIRKAASYGLLGDWAGFLASPIAPILAIANPGTSGVALWGLYKMGQRATRVGARLWQRMRGGDE